MAMTMPNPRPEPEARAGAASIDWPSVLAEHGHWLRTVICARLGEPQAIDEVMQEVSLAAVRQHAPLSDPAKVGAWLYRLAVRQSLLYRRKQGRRRKLIDRYAQRYRPSEADKPPGRPARLVVGRGASRAGSRGDVAAAQTRRGNPVAEIHRGLELSGVGRALGRQPQRRRDAAAPGPAAIANRVGGARRDARRSTNGELTAMNTNLDNMPLDDSRFDRLVDGELSEAERRELLAGLDSEPGGWRRCALAFLEAQCWKQEFGAIAKSGTQAATHSCA